jgi:hypothetical protein
MSIFLRCELLAGLEESQRPPDTRWACQSGRCGAWPTAGALPIGGDVVTMHVGDVVTMHEGDVVTMHVVDVVTMHDHGNVELLCVRQCNDTCNQG